MFIYASIQMWGSNRLGYHADHQKVSSYYTRDESEESITHRQWWMQVKVPPWLCNPKQTSSEVQSRDISNILKLSFGSLNSLFCSNWIQGWLGGNCWKSESQAYPRSTNGRNGSRNIAREGRKYSIYMATFSSCFTWHVECHGPLTSLDPLLYWL